MATQVRDQLLASNDEFRRLVDEHSQYSQRLENLIQKKYLSEDEKLEEVRLKKLKLRLKDQMESLEQKFRTDRPGHLVCIKPFNAAVKIGILAAMHYLYPVYLNSSRPPGKL